jgi:glycine betaine transporter
VVLIIVFVLILGFEVWGLLFPEGMTQTSVGVVDFVLDSVGWLYLAMCSGFLVLGAWLALGPDGRINLGPDDSQPEFSTPSWLAMLFAGAWMPGWCSGVWRSRLPTSPTRQGMCRPPPPSRRAWR